MKFYGSHICPNCEEAQALLDEKNLPYEYINITETTANLKEFLRIRDTSSVFLEVKENGRIGIPCFVKDDGTVTLCTENVLES